MQHFDLIIIGAGPGGYELAAEQARAGKSVALIERDALGGTCLNRGCIPTKCLCASASAILTVKRAADFGIDVASFTTDYPRAAARMRSVVENLRQGIDSMLKGVTVFNGEAHLAAGRTIVVGDQALTAPKIIIATGSRPASLPIEGANLAITSDDFLSLDELPASVVIVGGGVIGMEFASILAAFGVEVTVVEYCKEILPPFDSEVAKRLRSMLSRRGVKTVVGAAVSRITSIDGDRRSVAYQGKKGEETIECECVIMAVGRRPVLPEGLDEAGIRLTSRGFIEVNTDMQTSAEGIYAVGDVNGLCMLAHAASAQARVAVGENVDLSIIPSAVFTIPEVAMVGKTEQALQSSEIDYGTSKSMFAANGKALAMGEGEGFVKVLYDRTSRHILGVHIIGPHAADLIAEAAALMFEGVTVDQAAISLVHGHPTLSEAFAAACAACK